MKASGIIKGNEIGEVKRAYEIGYKGGDEWMWHACEICGKQRWAHLHKGKPLSLRCQPCSLKRPNRPELKDRQYDHAEGYVSVALLKDDFFYPMSRSYGYVFEHRLVMAKHLGRLLEPFPIEIVHHKNGDTGDNHIGNLELTTNGAHISAHMKEKRDGQKRRQYT